jgi:hypothetical protein
MMMTDNEISAALAKAIGWPKIVEDADQVYVSLLDSFYDRVFDYRAPDVAWPIAKRFSMFPEQSYRSEGGLVRYESKDHRVGEVLVYADTPEKAVALAVIGRLQ